MFLKIENLHKKYGDKYAVKDFSVHVKEKEFICLLGPSGCGKTTTLRIIGGFERPDSGEVIFENKNMNGVPPHKRHVNTIFQRYALFPHLNVYENVAFGLRVKKMPEKEIKTKVNDMLALVNLKGFEKRNVNSLSGGQQQRVAIARALALKPQILCFDEPTSALDPELTGEVLRVVRELADKKTTMLIVTHEMAFARDVADHVIFMDEGLIVEEGTPAQVITSPREERTRQFLSRFSNEP